MFYSQFILAKKGPLGTIWIAAHLERKLRKNQVSDTDIGVSVDSILFPEMPIALRLSSHLLLGVVRIYSKKVSYLFDDCSEALLKVKNAFRANAVDLPPEESTAPYHAITLPETFDLDDFELPDNENLQGNFVDHHVGARDQITLQDTMEGVVYSTSDFGRDERFGDGEASHLDLNEDLVAEKVETAGNTNVDPEAKTPVKEDENEDDLSDDDGVDQDQMEDSDGYDDGDADYVPEEYTEGPSTPGLWEEPNLPKVEETPTCVTESSQNATVYVPHQQEKSMDDFGPTIVVESNGIEVTDTVYEKEHTVSENWVRVEGQGSHATNTFDLNFFTQHGHDEDQVPCTLSNQHPYNITHGASNTYLPHLPPTLPVQGSFSDVNQQDKSTVYTSPFHATPTLLAVQETFSDVNNTSIYTQGDATNSQISVPDKLLGVQETFPEANNANTYTAPDRLLGVQETFPEAAYNANTYTAPDRLLGVQERFPEPAQNSYTPHFPPAERLLAVQERFSDAVLRQNTTPIQEKIPTGKKRSITESLFMSQSINFGDPSGLSSAQSVPSNDDILSSILVGRSSVMQEKPKRQRQSLPKPPKPPKLPKTGVPKRKVPMDESTVLHGDMIRQQLTDTSDIRRPRKKVSCTWLELSLIHKQLWEDEIFRESLFTGVSIKLASLHNRSYDLRKIRVSRIEALKPISQIDENAPLHEANKDVCFEDNTTETNPNYDGSQEEINEVITGPETATIDEKTDVPSIGNMDSSIDINSKYIDSKNDEIKMDIEAKDEVENKEETETLKPEEECSEKTLVPNPEGSFGIEVENVTSCSKDVLLDDKEISEHQDATNIEDNSDNDNDNDGDDWEYSPVQNNTDFLNFDDDDANDGEDADEDLSDTEAKRSIDNSGWSSRTKAVGKYLQVMFDKEGEHGRTGLRMNGLLTGKTRKEASRMFFETLVLKTKDYIHVEQNQPFDNIHILPRSKLLKSDF
ncbi:hypothetical protein LXL04_039369 [Taraxacum kok-saghyz]